MNENEIPMLDLDLNTLETSLPVIKPGIYELVIKNAEIIQPTVAGKAPALKLTMESTTPLESVPDAEGKVTQVEVGHPFFAQTQLAPTGKASWKMVAQNIAQVTQALRPRIEGKLSLPVDPWFKQLEGRTVRVKVAALPSRENPKQPGSMLRATNQVDEWYKN